MVTGGRRDILKGKAQMVKKGNLLGWMGVRYRLRVQRALLHLHFYLVILNVLLDTDTLSDLRTHTKELILVSYWRKVTTL